MGTGIAIAVATGASSISERARERQRDVITALRSGGANKDVVDVEKARLSELCQRLGAWYLQDQQVSVGVV